MSTKYTYSILNDFPNQKVDPTVLSNEIVASTVTIALDYISTDDDDCDVWFKADLSGGEQTTLSGVVVAHDGESLPDDATNVDLADELRDRSGKLRVHQTSRALGTGTCWTGVGDDPSDPHAIGGGEPFAFEHNTASGTATLTKYIDFNCVNNETWLHEGYITWRNAHFDALTLEMVPRVTTYTASSDTYYNLYGGYMVIPAAGDGTIELTSDITQHDGGLVYMPDDDLGEAPTAFWNADWNTSTKEYENISAAPYGDGRYNMFTVEICLARFLNTAPFLASGFIVLNSSDTDQMGHGMRLKMIFDVVDHHEVEEMVGIACIMCLHRDKSV
jgi:hypothetical protein